MSFVPLISPHVHIQSLDSASTPEAFAAREVELGTGTLTCTDHGSMGACREVYDLAKRHKLTPILGCEGYVRDDECPILKESGIERDAKGTYSKYNKYYHVTMHAFDQKGYEAMVKELSQADYRAEQHGSERKPLFTWAQLENLGAYNIAMTSGCLIGMVQRHLMADRPDIAIKYYDRLRSIPKFGNFYVEVFPHRCDKYWESGVFVTLEGGERLKYWKQKKLKTTLFDDISAEDLAKVVSKGKLVGQLVGQMDNRKWIEREPKLIIEAKLVEDFLQNECRPWAPDGDVQLGANKFMMHLAKSRGDKMLISDDAHFATSDEKIVQDSKLGGQGGSWKFANSYHRQSSEEAWEYFKNALQIPQCDFEALLDNNREWASKFKDFKFVDRKSLPTSFYPKDTIGHLKTLIDKHGRMNWGDPVWTARLRKEIKLLHQNGTIDLLPYFFLAEEVCYEYEKLGLLTGPGRGSAAGMLTAYALGITHANPLTYGLSEDRFLTEDRIKDGKLPDIDLDFPDREPLTNPTTGWLYKRFGENVAAISTNTMLRLKSSIKDVHRALHGRVDAEIEVLCKKLDNPPQGIEDSNFIFGYVGDDGKEVKGLIETSKELMDYTVRFPMEWGIVKKMCGIMRQRSRHACAMVICDEPVSNFIPLTTISGVRTTQYTASSVEAAGGLKMDFLGLNSLNDLSVALKLIQRRNGGEVIEDKIIGNLRVPGFRLVPFGGRYYDIWDLPRDQSVFNEIAESKTETVFQLNTNSARGWLKQFNYEKAPGVKAIDSIEAISAFTALDRPGPLDAKVTNPITNHSHNMLVEYANRAKGQPAVGAIGVLDQLLSETYGVMVYQESLQKIYQYLTGCDGIEANTFRTNIAKKKMDKVLKAYPNFIEKATDKIGAEEAQAIWDQTVTFGQYGFCKAHAVCYSIIAYACSFLKKHFPTEWWCAVLRNANKNEIAEKFWKYCKPLVDLPDVQFSGDVFEIRNNRIRAPLSFINGVGPAAHTELCQGRPYSDIYDFCLKISQRKLAGAKPVLDTDGKQVLDKKQKPKFRIGTTGLNTSVISRLIVAGVMDSLFPPDSTIIDKFNGYVNSMSAATQSVLGKRQPPKLNNRLLSLTPIERFQMQKGILPTHSGDALPILIRNGTEGIIVKDNAKYYWSESADTIRDIKAQLGGDADRLQRLEFVSGSVLKYYNEEYYVESGHTISTVVTAYITGERRFSYSKERQRTAVELTFAVDDEQFQFVKWPDRKTGELTAPQNLEGSVAILMLTRVRNDRQFTIDAIIVAQPPLSDEKSDETSPE